MFLDIVAALFVTLAIVSIGLMAASVDNVYEEMGKESVKNK